MIPFPFCFEFVGDDDERDDDEEDDEEDDEDDDGDDVENADEINPDNTCCQIMQGIYEKVLLQNHGIGTKIDATDGHPTTASAHKIIQSFEDAGAFNRDEKFVFFDAGVGGGSVTFHCACFDGQAGNRYICPIGCECVEIRLYQQYQAMVDWPQNKVRYLVHT